MSSHVKTTRQGVFQRVQGHILGEVMSCSVAGSEITSPIASFSSLRLVSVRKKSRVTHVQNCCILNALQTVKCVNWHVHKYYLITLTQRHCNKQTSQTY